MLSLSNIIRGRGYRSGRSVVDLHQFLHGVEGDCGGSPPVSNNFRDVVELVQKSRVVGTPDFLGARVQAMDFVRQAAVDPVEVGNNFLAC